MKTKKKRNKTAQYSCHPIGKYCRGRGWCRLVDSWVVASCLRVLGLQLLFFPPRAVCFPWTPQQLEKGPSFAMLAVMKDCRAVKTPQVKWGLGMQTMLGLLELLSSDDLVDVGRLEHVFQFELDFEISSASAC
jgi:hypothetical protein